MSRASSSGWRIVAVALSLGGAIDGCSNPAPAPRADAAVGGRRVPIVPGAPQADRLAALGDLDPGWVRRTQIAGLYDGARIFFRGRTSDASGPSTHANSPTFQIVLGNRSGSQGADMDRDGLSDTAEVRIGTDPRNFDTDGDTIPDGFEIFGTITNPLLRDSDSTGLDDNVEVDLDDPMTYVDSDGDGLTNSQESAALNSNPEAGDSDGDGFNDGDEFLMNTPMSDREHPQRDTDGDHMPQDFEEANATDPSSMTDTDHDGLPDWLDPEAVATVATVAGGRGVVRARQEGGSFPRFRQGFTLRAEACMSTAPPGVGYRVGSTYAGFSATGRDRYPQVAREYTECMAGDVAVGMAVDVVSNSSRLVKRMALRCASLNNAGTGVCGEDHHYWRGGPVESHWHRRECPPNQMVVGMRMRLGGVIDGFSVICAPLGWNGSSVRTVLENLGGNGGDVSPDQLCWSGGGVAQIDLTTITFAGEAVALGLNVYCRPLEPRAILEVGPQEMGTTRAGSISVQGQTPATLDPPLRAECPDGQVAVGISVEANSSTKPSFTRLRCAPLNAARTGFGEATWFPAPPADYAFGTRSAVGMCEPQHHLVGVRVAWSGPSTSTNRHVHAIFAVCAPLGWIAGVPTSVLGPWGTGFAPENTQEALCPASSAIDLLDVQFVAGSSGGNLEGSTIGALSASCRPFFARGTVPMADAGVPGDVPDDASGAGYAISASSAGEFDFQGTGNRMETATPAVVVGGECPAETLAVGLAVDLNDDLRDSLGVSQGLLNARLLCAPLSRDRRGFGPPRWAGAEPGQNWKFSFCAVGQHLVGLRAQGDQWVTRLTAVCAPLGWNAGSRLTEAGSFGSDGTRDEGFCAASGGIYRLDVRQVRTRGNRSAEVSVAQAVWARCRAVTGADPAIGADAGADASTGSLGQRYGVYPPRTLLLDRDETQSYHTRRTPLTSRGCADDQVATGLALTESTGFLPDVSSLICLRFNFGRRALLPVAPPSYRLLCPAGEVVVGVKYNGASLIGVLCAPLNWSAPSTITRHFVVSMFGSVASGGTEAICPTRSAVTLVEDGFADYSMFVSSGPSGNVYRDVTQRVRLRVYCSPLTSNGAGPSLDGGVMDGGVMDGGVTDVPAMPTDVPAMLTDAPAATDATTDDVDDASDPAD